MQSIGRTVFLAMIASTALLAPSRASGSPTGQCWVRHAPTVLTTREARVYERFGYVYACLYRYGRRVVLANFTGHSITGTGGQRNYRFAGRYVAFEDFYTGKMLGSYYVFVYDLRTGRLVHEAQTGKPPADASSQTQGAAFGLGPTTALLLEPDGSVAWIARDAWSTAPGYPSYSLVPDYEVRVAVCVLLPCFERRSPPADFRHLSAGLSRSRPVRPRPSGRRGSAKSPGPHRRSACALALVSEKLTRCRALGTPARLGGAPTRFCALAEADGEGPPTEIDGQPVAHVRGSWVIEDRWWTEQPLRRRYWELVSRSGRDIVVFGDLLGGGWFRHR